MRSLRRILKALFYKHAFESKLPQITLEDEIRALGYQFEKCKQERTGLPKFVHERYSRAMSWAASARMSRSALNYLLAQGEDVAVRS